MAQPTILLAGAAGDLGARIAKALISRGAAVRALVRHDVSAADRDLFGTAAFGPYQGVVKPTVAAPRRERGRWRGICR